MALSTPVALRIRPEDDYPYEGRLEYRGAGLGVVSLTALNKAQVRIDFDRDGDGVAEESSVQAWSSLE